MGFAPPEISDLYTGVKVPVLKPAYYNNYEIGGWYGLAAGKAAVEASLYRMQGNNEIISVRLDDGSYQNRNAGKTLHYGVEYTLKYTPSRSLLFIFNGTNAHHEFLDYQQNGKDYSHRTMNAAPGMIFNTEITYKPGWLQGFRIAAEWQHVGKYFIDPANTQVYHGYELFNVRTGYAFHGLEFWLNVLNMFNRIYATAVDYASYGNSYRPGLPRTFQFGITYSFTGKQENNAGSK
jgi:outer membrane receptor protein involved in Fe transport